MSLIAAGLSALDYGHSEGADAAGARLAQLATTSSGRGAVTTTLTGLLTDCVTTAWQRGWQPADVHRFAGRVFGPAEQDLLGDAMAHELSRYAKHTVEARWHDQLSEVSAATWWGQDMDLIQARSAVSDGGLASWSSWRCTPCTCWRPCHRWRSSTRYQGPRCRTTACSDEPPRWTGESWPASACCSPRPSRRLSKRRRRPSRLARRHSWLATASTWPCSRRRADLVAPTHPRVAGSASTGPTSAPRCSCSPWWPMRTAAVRSGPRASGSSRWWVLRRTYRPSRRCSPRCCFSRPGRCAAREAARIGRDSPARGPSGSPSSLPSRTGSVSGCSR